MAHILLDVKDTSVEPKKYICRMPSKEAKRELQPAYYLAIAKALDKYPLSLSTQDENAACLLDFELFITVTTK